MHIACFSLNICVCSHLTHLSFLPRHSLTQMQSGDPLRMHNSLLALRQVSKRLEYKSGEGREPLEVIVNSALPLAQALVRQLIETDNNSLEAALIMKLCLKVVWYRLFIIRSLLF